MREFKKGDYVIYSHKEKSDRWKKINGFTLYNKNGKIIDIYGKKDITYVVKFRNQVHNNIGEKAHKQNILNLSKDEFKLAIDHLKFKKWIKG